MKFVQLLTASLLATVSLAQRAVIGYPADGATVTAGSQIVVEIDRPNSLSGSTEVAVVLGIQSCSSGICHPPADLMGTILYNGGFSPQYQANATFKPPHQNFTVTIPAATRTGLAQLGVIHVSLIGAGQEPFLETLNITLNVVNSSSTS